MKTKVTAIPGAREIGLNGTFQVALPLGVKLVFAGAPFPKRGVVHNAFVVKCATEQRGAADVEIPCEDFGVPTDRAMLNGVDRAIEAAFAGKQVFAGCAGGIGRTGTFLTVVLKALGADPTGYDGHSRVPLVNMIRKVYLGHAVETSAQEKLISTIDVSAIQAKIRRLWFRAVLRKYVPFFGR
jgi:hypothetical protein